MSRWHGSGKRRGTIPANNSIGLVPRVGYRSTAAVRVAVTPTALHPTATTRVTLAVRDGPAFAEQHWERARFAHSGGNFPLEIAKNINKLTLDLILGNRVTRDMNEREYHERLDSTAEDPEELFEHFEQRSAAGRMYHALPDARHGVERGTVIVDEAAVIVRGYPRVPRVLVLESGVPSFFEAGASVAIEEKLDGFNVRIADIGEPIAFTRSGYVCPYTTARTRELLDLDAFFADHPGKMLCAELIGPETPYTSHDYDDVDSHAVRVFGIRDRESGQPLPVGERRELCRDYSFPQPRHCGQYDPAEAAEQGRTIIDQLDSAGREGIVMKSADGERMVKYTTESQHHAELAYAFSLPFDRGRDFMFSRIIREAFQAVEFDEDDDRLQERAGDLGESILRPMVETIRDVDNGETIGERQVVRGAPEPIDALLDHLRDQSLTIDVEADRHDNGERVVEFVKRAESSRDRIQCYLAGGTRDE